MASMEKYRTLVDRLEQEARRSPTRYKVKLALLAGFGFAVLAGSVVASFALSIGLVVALVVSNPLLLVKLIKVIWIPIAFGGTVLDALWVRFRLPRGYRLHKEQAPELRAEIERLRVAAHAPRLSGIYIDNELNAAAASIPRGLGLFGHRHYLILGLPLMQLLDRAQFASVVAHEFGHFGGRQGHFAGWIYRVRMSWYRLLKELGARRSPAAGMFAGFFRWYAPYFDAYSFALARRNEYDADATAARLTDPRTTAHALLRVNLGSARLERDFWPHVQRGADTSPQPPDTLFQDMAHSLRTPGEDDASRLESLLRRPSSAEDTHPSLTQRLEALGVVPEVVPASSQTAAEALLGDLLPSFEMHFTDEWRELVDVQWKERFRGREQARSRLQDLEAQAERSAAEDIEHAHLVEELRNAKEALPLYRQVLEAAPNSAFAHFRYGALLLATNDEAGIDHLRTATQLDANATPPAMELLVAFFTRTGASPADAEVLLAELRGSYERRAQAAQARRTLKAGDRLDAHGLEASTLASAAQVAATVPGLHRIWLARKRIDDSHAPSQLIVLTQWKRDVAEQNVRLSEGLARIDRLQDCAVFSATHGIGAKIAKQAGVPVWTAS